MTIDYFNSNACIRTVLALAIKNCVYMTIDYFISNACPRIILALEIEDNVHDH